MGTKRGEGKRSVCIVCSEEFPARGKQVACSEVCSRLHREAKKAARPARVRRPQLCTDKNDKQYILDRIRLDEKTGCWVWQKSLRPQTGYGQVGGYPHTAHRLSYMLWKGEIGDLLVRHQCHNKVCCNPDHLLLGDGVDNWYDSEEAHRTAAEKMRGIPAQNRIAVVVNGVTYVSKVEAMKELGVGHRTLAKMIESELSEAA